MRDRRHQGGVVSYYNSILPHLKKNAHIVCYTLGAKFDKKSWFHPIKDQIRFSLFLETQQPDLVHVNPSLGFKSFFRDGIIIWQARRKNIPVLIFFHGWQKPFQKIVNLYFKWFFNLTYLKGNCFIVLASEFKKVLIDWGVKAEIFIETTTVDDKLLISNVLNTKEQKGKTSIPKNILFLSRIEKEKGVFETLHAFFSMIDKGHNLFLNIAGSGSALMELKNLVINSPYSKRIKFLGYISGVKKSEAFVNNDIYCLPSYSEGMPNSVLEAMAFGMPIITTSVGGLSDFFQNGKMGFLVKKKSPKDIEDCIQKLMDNDSLFSNICRYNFEYAQNNFLSSKVSKKLLTIYKKTLHL